MNSPCKAGKDPIGRHDLVFVRPEGWRAMLATRGDLAADPLITRWSERGWPTVRRRAMPGEATGVALGLPLPPSAGKKRLSFLLPSDGITSVVRPPLLKDARASAPRAWWAALGRLEELAFRHSAEVRLFGSLAWATLTGLEYVTDRSDLDLLLDVGCDTDLDRLVSDIAAIEADAPMRLDGELVREDSSAVNWREFYAGGREVLVKDIEGVRLLDRDLFISGRTRS